VVRYDHAMQQSIFNSSLASAFLYMHLAATSLGLASQWVSLVTSPNNHLRLKGLLNIPAGIDVYDMMALGYPAYRSRQKLMRPLDKIVHRDYFGEDDFRTDDEVKDFIKKTRAWVNANHRRGIDKK